MPPELPAAAAAVRCVYSLNSCAKFKLLDGSEANHRWDRRAEQPIRGRTGGLSSQSEVGKNKVLSSRSHVEHKALSHQSQVGPEHSLASLLHAEDEGA